MNNRHWLTALTLALSLGWMPLSNAQEQKPVKIGISVSDLSNPYFRQLARAAEAEAGRIAGGVDVLVVSSAYDLPRQSRQLQRFFTEGYHIILVSAASYDGLTPTITELRAQGAKIIAVDVKAEGVDATITTDNNQAGSISCDYIAEQLNGKGTVGVINGPPVSSIIDRVDGCLDVLAQHSAIEVLDTDQNGGGTFDGGFERMTHLLTAFPEINAVFAINDPSAMGAEQAALAAGRNDVMIVSVDGAPEAKLRIKEGDTLIKATAAQFPSRIGALAAELGIRLAAGEELTQPTRKIETELITVRNVWSYRTW